MKQSECGYATPPPEDSPDREAMDRFADFIRLVGPPNAPRTPEQRAALRGMLWGDDFVAWRRFIFGDERIHGPAF